MGKFEDSLVQTALLMSGNYRDNQNGVDFSFTVGDIDIESTYAFGIGAALYIMSKKPSGLEKFLAKYGHLTNTDRFIYPTNIEKSKIKDATIIANALLQCAELMYQNKDKEDVHKKAANGIAMDTFRLFQEVFPKYSEKVHFDDYEYAEERRSLLKLIGLNDETIRKTDYETAAKIFTLGLYGICTENDIPQKIITATFSLVATNANMVKFLSYDMPIRKFGENPSNYMNSMMASARKCKDFSSLLNEMLTFYDKDATEEEMENKWESDDAHDEYIYELATILLMNGFNLYEEVSKNDVVTALQVRSAFSKYLGEENPDRNKIFANLIVSVLSKKLKDAALQKNATISKDTKVYVDENKKVLELEEKNKNLVNQNKELTEKIDQIKRKVGKEDARMESLEKKIKELELSLKEKEKELEEYRLAEKEEEDVLLPEVVERDYQEILSQFTKEHSTVMVGGNYNLVLKMKNILPDITYIMTKEASRLTDELVRNATIVLFKTDSVSHSLWEAALSKCDRYEVPYAYTREVTNANALMRSMCEVIEEKLELDLNAEMEADRDDI